MIIVNLYPFAIALGDAAVARETVDKGVNRCSHGVGSVDAKGQAEDFLRIWNGTISKKMDCL